MFSIAIPAGVHRPRPLFCLIAALFGAPVLAADAPAGEERTLPAVTVTGQSTAAIPTEQSGLYTARRSSSATKLDLSLRETPQAVSVISRKQMDDFKLNNVNDALSASSGIVVERVETNRSYYTARGFDVTNFQTDGVGMPFIYGNVNGDIDTAAYDRVDAVYGANGLMSSTGYPSATINFIRKRPTVDLAASASLTAGSWNTYRVDADVSKALIASGLVRGRLVFAREDGNSHLDRYAHAKTMFYGIVEADLGESTLLALGHQHQRNQAKSPLWGSLPLLYSDGTRTDYDVSTSTAADWARWNSRMQSTFLELSHEFANGWQGKAVLTRNIYANDGALFYVYGAPDRVTGLGLFAYPSLYEMENRQTQADVYARGRFELGGRQHDLMFGANWAKSTLDDVSHYGRGIGTPLPPLENWAGDYPMPVFDASIDGSKFSFRQRSAYAATRLNPTDRLKLIAGVRATKAESDGTSYGVGRQSSASAVTPYFGAIYDLTRQFSVYGSYTDIFNPQYQVDAVGNPLRPVEGTSREVGLKGEFFDKKLNFSLALFRTEQSNLAEVAGYNGAKAFYRGINARSKGFQAEVSGQVTENLQANLGYTQLSIHDDGGSDVRTYAPRRLVRLSATYRVPGTNGLKVGANLNWQGDTYVQSGASEIRQSAYVLLNLMARYELNKQLSVSANFNNVTDKKYIASLYWGSDGQGYYGAPRNASVSLNWKY